MDKASDAFRTISEVANELGVPKHVLRFWESKFPQVKPMKRGGGRRYYRPEDLLLLDGIRTLLHSDGYTIKGVQKILREKGVDVVKQTAMRPGGGLKQNNKAGSVSRLKAAPAAKRKTNSSQPGAGKAKSPVAASALTPPEFARKIDRAISELEACRELIIIHKPDSKPRASQTRPKQRASRAVEHRERLASK